MLAFIVAFERVELAIFSVTNEFNCSATSGATSVTAQTCPVTLHLRFFIEGFYTGNGNMRATIDPVNLPLVCDIVKVELHNPTPPYARARFIQGTINTDGRGNFTFPAQVAGHSYYIVLYVDGRNSIVQPIILLH